MLFSLSTNCCTADTILRILCREPQRTGDRRTVLERLAHHGELVFALEEAAEDAGMTVEEFKKVMENTSLQAV